MLIIQLVEIHWTKATRGAPRANERARLPRRFAIDPAPGECVVQRLRMEEAEAFAPKRLALDALPRAPGSVGVLRITPQKDGAFALGITGTPHGGQPPRRALADVIALRPGEWATIAINARHASTSGQFYSEATFNVACGDVVAGDTFLAGEPDHALDLKADLF